MHNNHIKIEHKKRKRQRERKREVLNKPWVPRFNSPFCNLISNNDFNRKYRKFNFGLRKKERSKKKIEHKFQSKIIEFDEFFLFFFLK